LRWFLYAHAVGCNETGRDRGLRLGATLEQTARNQ
jgi:hypothetical protein